MGVGTVLNVLAVSLLPRAHLQSRLTLWLLRAQSLCDLLVCLMTILLFWIDAFPYWDDIGGFLSCHLWSSQTFYWMATSASTANVVCIVVDRLWATVYAATYRRNQVRYLVLCCIGNFIYSMACSGPDVLLVQYENHTCSREYTSDIPAIEEFRRIHRYLWLVLYYMLPLVAVSVCHGYVVWHIRRRLRPQSNLPEESQTNSTAELSESGSGQSANIVNSLTLGAMGFIICLALAHSYDTFFYAFEWVFGTEYIVGSSEQLLGLFLNSMNASVNPILIAVSVPSFRRSCVQAARYSLDYIRQEYNEAYRKYSADRPSSYSDL
ncbi:amine GPCR [Clonorchis sinensis]|uniref:Amine GPCR n=1 Tax=Clonorchis sinensis TaxID=79923 RepID=H2KSN2_CLOSI|nr:amine GPCR [Clonorchis sinensis]